MPKDIDGIFKGFSNSATDLLPCPRCYSLKCKYVENTDYYTRRYQCKDCGQFFRYDKRPVDSDVNEFAERENLNLQKNS